MSPLVALHATSVTHRQSIRRHGLRISVPRRGRPCGVYVFADQIRHGTIGKGGNAQRVTWSSDRGQDVWQVAYIGRTECDWYVENGLILLDPVPPEYVTLVTCHND